jgi:hypothetical protein
MAQSRRDFAHQARRLSEIRPLPRLEACLDQRGALVRSEPARTPPQVPRRGSEWCGARQRVRQCDSVAARRRAAVRTAAIPVAGADRPRRAQRGIDLRSLPGRDAFPELFCGTLIVCGERWHLVPRLAGGQHWCARPYLAALISNVLHAGWRVPRSKFRFPAMRICPPKPAQAGFLLDC